MSNNRIHLIDGLRTSVRPPIHPDADPTERGASGEEAKSQLTNRVESD
jgi:hypothetical protein